MKDLTPWCMQAEVEWIVGGPIAPLDWEAFPILKTSIVFADVARRELFSTSGTATALIRPHAVALRATCAVEVLLPSTLLGYVREGAQFLVVRGSVCIGVGTITDVGGPTGGA